MRLENARCLIQTDPADAARLVDAVHADLREAIAELRRLAHGIHPAELSRRGLIAALRTLARRAAIPVDLKAEDVGRLPPQIEATAYYIAAEATANAVKHANADHLQIVLVRTAGTLRLTITDDGAGEPPSLAAPDCKASATAPTRQPATLPWTARTAARQS
jgi:signal transduction histidine kinase